MGREKQGYRDTIEDLNRLFPDKGMLSVKEVCEFCDMCRNTVKKKIRFDKATNKITKSDLARQICL